MFRIDENGKFRYDKPTEKPVPVSEAQKTDFSQSVNQALKERQQAGGSGTIDHTKESLAVVEAGDAPAKIAADNGISLEELEAANKGIFSSNDPIRPNEVIFIPQPDPVAAAKSARDSKGIPTGEAALKNDLMARGQELQIGTNDPKTYNVVRQDIQNDVKAYLDTLPAQERSEAARRLLGEDSDWTNASAGRLAVRDAIVENFAVEIYGKGNKVEYADDPNFDHKAETGKIAADVKQFLEGLPEGDRAGALQSLYNRDWRDAGPAQIAIEQAAGEMGLPLRETKHIGSEMAANGFAEGLYDRANKIEYADQPNFDYTGETAKLTSDVKTYIDTLPEADRNAALQYIYDRDWKDAGPGQIAIENAASELGLSLRPSGHTGPETEAAARVILDKAQQAGSPAEIKQAFHDLSLGQPEGVLQALKSNPEAVEVLNRAENQDKVDKWLDGQDLEYTDGVNTVIDALNGKNSELGTLTDDTKKYLLDKVFVKAVSEDRLSDVQLLADTVSRSENASLRALVSERMANKAATLQSPAEGTQPSEEDPYYARAFANSAVTAATDANSLHTASVDVTSLQTTMESLGPEKTAAFIQALGARFDYDTAQSQIDRNNGLTAVLMAANSGKPSPTTSAAVQNVFALSDTYSSSLWRGIDDKPGAMAQAISREWYPDDPTLQKSEAERLQSIFDTRQGKELLFQDTGVDASLPLEARTRALSIVRADKSINADTVKKTDDPWQNPLFINDQAQETAGLYLSSRGNDPIVLSGTDLDNTVGTAMGFPPTVPDGMSNEEMQEKVAKGELSLFQGDDNKPVQEVINGIRSVGGENPQVTVLPIQYSSNQTGPINLPLFRVETSDGPKFVDNTGRTYNNFDDWKSDNQLPPGSMTYPKDGQLTQSDGKVELSGPENTPKTPDTFVEHAKQVIDVAALVGGIVVGTALIIGTGGTATPFVVGAGMAFAGWGAYRVGEQIVDRAQHGQDINPITSDDARMLWLDGVSSLAGAAAFGSTAKLAGIAAKGATITPTMARIIGTTRAVSNVADAAAITNLGIYSATNWSSMSGQERATAILSMGFWGVTMGMNVADLPSGGGARTVVDMFNPVAQTSAILKNYNIPTSENPDLPAGTIKMVESPPGSGNRTVEYAPGSDPANINIHRQLAILDMQENTLKGLLGDKAPEMGTPAGQLFREELKTSRLVADLQKKLEDPNLSAADRAIIQGEISDRSNILNIITQKVKSGDTSGLNEIYQHPVGREVAQHDGPNNGYKGSSAEALDQYCQANNLNRADYNFRLKQGSLTEVEIYRLNDAATKLELSNANGTPKITERSGSISNNEKGKIAEHYIQVELEAQGYEVITIQNASGNGVDVFAVKGNDLIIGEVKANTATLSAEQNLGGETFAISRLQQAADGEGAYSNLPLDVRQKAKAMLDKVLGLEGYDLKPLEINVQLTPDGDISFVRHRSWDQSPQNDKPGPWQYDENF